MFLQELQKMIKSPAFMIAIMCASILLMTGTIYRSNMTGEEFSVIDFMISDEKDVLYRESGLYSYDVIVRGENGYFVMFLPILTAVPFVAVLCGEKKNNNTRFEIYRVGKNRYAIGKGMAALVAGGLIVMMGYILFVFIVMAVFPHGMGEINQMQNVWLKENSIVCRLLLKHMSLSGLIIVKIFRMFLYGAFMAAPAYGLSVMIQNRYIILSVPFMVFYLLNKIVEKRGTTLWYDLLPENIGNIYEMNFIIMICLFGGTVLVIFIFYRVYLGRKCDCGDS